MGLLVILSQIVTMIANVATLHPTIWVLDSRVSGGSMVVSQNRILEGFCMGP